MDKVVVKTRDKSVDVFRGIAMLLVIMGHTLSGTTKNYENTFVFSVIWTLQMPMFMLISGYVNKYSLAPYNIQSLMFFIKKRSVAYIMPWVVWTVLVRGIVFQNELLLNIRYILWHMDSGYWFLTSLWTICLIWGFSRWLSSVVYKRDNSFIVLALTIFFSLCGSGLLAIIGINFGLEFFGIKLSLYYTLFYLIGYIFGQLQTRFETDRRFCSLINWCVPLLAAVYFGMLIRYNTTSDQEDIMSIAIRIIASVTGCASVFGFGVRFISTLSDSRILSKLAWIGCNSLGIYLIHSLFLCLINVPEKRMLFDFEQFVIVICSFVLTTAFSVFFVRVIDCHPIARMLLFGKIKLTNKNERLV